jgi:hypothetical protein
MPRSLELLGFFVTSGEPSRGQNGKEDRLGGLNFLKKWTFSLLPEVASKIFRGGGCSHFG